MSPQRISENTLLYRTYAPRATWVDRPSIDSSIHSDESFWLFFFQLQTTVYMSCGRCGKPILAQQGGSMCATCRSPAAQCSIWYVSFSSSLAYSANVDSNHDRVATSRSNPCCSSAPFAPTEAIKPATGGSTQRCHWSSFCPYRGHHHRGPR